jgi:predicted PurR-regulated permease PerM
MAAKKKAAAAPVANPAAPAVATHHFHHAPDPAGWTRGLPRVISLVALLVVLWVIGVAFFKVMAGLLLPLFLAAVLTVVFRPLHAWSLEAFGDRRHLAALFTTLMISLVVIVPTGYFGYRASIEAASVYRTVAGKGTDFALEPKFHELEYKVVDWYKTNIDPKYQHTEINFTQQAASFVSAASEYAVKLGLDSAKALVGMLIGLVVMLIALYFFFADGPGMLDEVMHLSPLDSDYERELLTQFAQVSRAVVLATLISAVVQGLLAGIGYYFALPAGSPLFLLTVLTTLLAIVPFVGATAVWIPVALWILFVEQNTWTAVLFALYGAGVVSSIDNVIKPLVLHGQSNLHPLLALLSVLGGIQLMGPIGLLVGPMVVSFMQALLVMLRKELDSLSANPLATQGPPLATREAAVAAAPSDGDPL